VDKLIGADGPSKKITTALIPAALFPRNLLEESRLRYVSSGVNLPEGLLAPLFRVLGTLDGKKGKTAIYLPTDSHWFIGQTAKFEYGKSLIERSSVPLDFAVTLYFDKENQNTYLLGLQAAHSQIETIVRLYFGRELEVLRSGVITLHEQLIFADHEQILDILNDKGTPAHHIDKHRQMVAGWL